MEISSVARLGSSCVLQFNNHAPHLQRFIICLHHLRLNWPLLSLHNEFIGVQCHTIDFMYLSLLSCAECHVAYRMDRDF